MRGQKGDNLVGGETSVGHASEDLVGRVERLRDGAIRSEARVVGATGEELEAGATTAVGDTDGAGELDAASIELSELD